MNQANNDQQANSPTQPEVNTVNGRVRGSQQGGIFSFKSIPYAAPVEKLNRWLATQPPAPWKGTLDATRFGSSAPQYLPKAPLWLLPKAGVALIKLMDGLQPPGPDCLSLNVWTPALAPDAGSTEKLPVIFWIHGGGLSSGSSNMPVMDGTALAKKGAVVVSANYRVGGIGFLAGDGLFEDDVLSGNRGFKDLVAALQWVQDNIAQFGGDTGNVTVFGQSAGGTCVWGLLASPTTEGLFHRAIAMSGPIVMIDIADQLKLTRDVLKEMKVPVGDVEALANVSNDLIVGTKIQTMLYRRGEPYGAMSHLRLPAAGAYHTEFMPEDVLEAMANARLRNIDLLVGSSKNDGRVAVVSIPLLPKTLGIRMVNTMFNGLVGNTKAERKAVVAKYKAAMPGASSYTVHEQLQTDALYRVRTIKAAEIHSRVSSGKTFMYQFNWLSPAFKGVYGSFHGFDSAFAFNNLSSMGDMLGDANDQAAAQPLADAMSDAWVSFARTGVPAAAGMPEWPQYETDRRQTMLLDTNCAVVDDPGGELREIWKN